MRKIVTVEFPVSVAVDIPADIMSPLTLTPELRDHILLVARGLLKSNVQVGAPQITYIRPEENDTPYTGKDDGVLKDIMPELKGLIGNLTEIGKSLDKAFEKAVKGLSEKDTDSGGKNK